MYFEGQCGVIFKSSLVLWVYFADVFTAIEDEEKPGKPGRIYSTEAFVTVKSCSRDIF